MEKTVVIRRMQEKDAEAVGRLWYRLSKHHEVFHTYYEVREDGERQLIAHVYDLLRRECIGFVAEVDGVVEGFVTGYIVRRNPQLAVEKVGKVDNIFVSDEVRGQGLGTQLLERLASFYTDQGIRFVEISCDLQNPDALRLYKRLGFVEQKIMLIKNL
jgi:ribosomal protein S18 acetylase RimI-like enzyme